MPTFASVLQDQLRRDPGRPLVTFYDDATGERIELSVTTYANWVAKTASLAQEELDLGRGDRVLVDLPTHWLGPVWLGAAWSLGLEVVTEGPAALVVCGPADVESYAAGEEPVVALSLRPMGGRFLEELPQGVVDFGAEVFAQPDSFLAYDPPAEQDAAYAGRSHEDLIASAARSADGVRLLTDRNPVRHPESLLGPLLAGGGTVWVAHPDPAGWEHRAATERATEVDRAAP